MQDTVLRGTFNSTLNNPVLTKLQNRALREEKSATATLASGSNVQALASNRPNHHGEVPVHS